MVREFKMRSSDNFWSFRVDLEKNPTIFFANPKVSTNVIYTTIELASILERTDADNAFIPIPRQTMQAALNEYNASLSIAA